jgi:hypothetical protein
MHDAGSQVDNNGIDGFFAVQWVTILIHMIADRAWDINMVALDRLERLHGVLLAFPQQA